MNRRRRLWAAFGLCLVAAAGCEDDPVSPTDTLDAGDLEALEPGLHPILSVPGLEVWRPSSLTRVSLHLQGVQVDRTVGSVQGELGFDPGRMELVDVTFPDGLLGAWNLVAPGRVRFAGVTLEGVGSRPVLDVLVRTREAPRAADFRIELEEVAALEDFTDLGPSVVKREVPLLTGLRLDGRLR